jgi:RecB family endonuclease NucS
LRIIDGGKEKCIDGLRFDIVAKDLEGRAVIIELKAGEEKKDSVYQLLSYIGAEMESGDTRLVRGIIVAESFDYQTKLAARAVENIRVSDL